MFQLYYLSLQFDHYPIKFYEQALSIARELGDRFNEGNSLYNMGIALYDVGEKENAMILVKQALAIYEAIKSPYVQTARDLLKE